MTALRWIQRQDADRIATVSINRPEKLNALNLEVLEELDACFAELDSSSEVGAVILTGTGSKAFVAGADISELAGLGIAASKQHAMRGQAVFDRIERLSKPVIAAINGFALGGGLELAMACHMRVAAENAQMGQPEVGLGLIPGFGGTQRLARLVGPGKAYELILGGGRVRAEEAQRIGLVNRVCSADELLDTSRALAARVLRNAPLAVTYAMQAIRRGLEGSLAEGLALESDLFALSCGTEDMREGTQAFLEKRKPAFKGQ